MYEELVKRLRSHNGWALNKTLDEAADAIESTNKAYQMISEAYEAEVTKQNWIPVAERLPEKYDCYYLVVLNNWNTDFCLYTKEKGFGMYITSKWWDANDEVTHWMPLPEPPKEET